MTTQQRNRVARRSAEDYLQYRILYGLCFLVFLAVVALQRMSPTAWGRRGSMLGETRNRTQAAVPMVFANF